MGPICGRGEVHDTIDIHAGVGWSNVVGVMSRVRACPLTEAEENT